MLISMGTLAIRDEIDISGITVAVDVEGSERRMRREPSHSDRARTRLSWLF
jgi:hypothetical protein